MFNIFQYGNKKPSKQEVLAARKVISEADKAQAAEKNAEHLAKPATTKPATFAQALAKAAQALQRKDPRLAARVAKTAEEIEAASPGIEEAKRKLEEGLKQRENAIREDERRKADEAYEQRQRKEEQQEAEDSKKVELPMTYTDTRVENYQPFEQSKTGKYEVVDMLAPATSSPVYLVNDFYLMYHEGRCYFQKANSVSAPVELRKTSAPISKYATYNLTKLDQSEALTEEDLALLLKSKPSAEQIEARFAKYSCKGIEIDRGNAAQVW